VLRSPRREAFGPKANLFAPDEAGELDRAVGVLLGLAVGGILGAIAGGLSYLIRLPGRRSPKARRTSALTHDARAVWTVSPNA
jgi:hypothetical protein